MSDLNKEDNWEATDAVQKVTESLPISTNNCDDDENLENYLKIEQASRKSICESIDKSDVTKICKELFKLSLTGLAERSKQDVISTMTDSLMKWLDQQNIPQITSAKASKFDEVDSATAADSTSNVEKNSITPSRWMVRFFVNNHILKDATFNRCDNNRNGTWKVTEYESRDGIEADIENAKYIFEKILLRNYDDDWENDVIQWDKNVEDILSNLNKIAKNWSSQDYDGLICFFSSHGTEGHILGSDGKLLSVSDICSSLNIIADPKLLFIQACQGTQANPGILLPTVKEISKKNPISEISNFPSAVEESDAISKRLVAPLDHNLLIYYSSTSHYESYRNSKYGSVMFIFLFLEIIKFHRDSKNESDCIDIYDLLTRVNEDMKNYTSMSKAKQMPVFVNTLTKRVKLLMRQVNISSEELNNKLKNVIPPCYLP